MSNVLEYRNDPKVQQLLNDPRVQAANSFRSFFDNMRKVAKEKGLEDVVKHLLTKGDAGYQVHVSLIDEEPGFNPRDYNDPEVRESIDLLADRYAKDQFVEDITATIRDGRVLVREGHTRRHAFRKAVTELKAPIVRLSLRPFSGDKAEEDLIPITSNSGNRLRPIAAAMIMARQIERHGKTPKEVAAALGKTETHVRQSLKLLEMPENMQDLVRKNLIAPDLALELVNEHGINAYEIATEAMREGAESASKGEVKKDVEGDQKPAQRITRKKLERGTPAAIKLNKKSKEHLWSTLDTLVGKIGDEVPEKATVELTREEIESLKNLHKGFHEQMHGKPEDGENAEAETEGDTEKAEESNDA